LYSIEGTYLLSFEHISHKFSHHSLFSDITLQIPESRVLITGPNGSGKTTLLLIAAGLIYPTSGKVKFAGHGVSEINIKKRIGISASKVALPEFFKVKEFLEFHCNQFDCELDEHWLREFDLVRFLKTKVKDLSLGNYKKLSLMSAILHKPELLLLDEPTNGLDKQARIALDKLLGEYPGQVIIASHEVLHDVKYFERHIDLSCEMTRKP
jgi:ABC-type multidrug transport system ATPase subunit